MMSRRDGGGIALFTAMKRRENDGIGTITLNPEFPLFDDCVSHQGFYVKIHDIQNSALY